MIRSGSFQPQRCWNFVVGTALWELRCGNCVVRTVLWELRCENCVLERQSKTFRKSEMLFVNVK
jgi:hypothetical protein